MENDARWQWRLRMRAAWLKKRIAFLREQLRAVNKQIEIERKRAPKGVRQLIQKTKRREST